MRVISGIFKGKKIFLPEDENTRPLRDLVKESIFNLILHSKNIKPNIYSSSILDLFSGTGSFGLECISRGASKVYFVENYDQSIEILNKNIKKLKCENKAKVLNENASNAKLLIKAFVENYKKDYSQEIIDGIDNVLDTAIITQNFSKETLIKCGLDAIASRIINAGK